MKRILLRILILLMLCSAFCVRTGKLANEATFSESENNNNNTTTFDPSTTTSFRTWSDYTEGGTTTTTVITSQSVPTTTEPADVIPFDEIYYQNPPRFERCQEKLRLFSNASANFTQCVLWYARPIRICEECVFSYKQANAAFVNIAVQDPEDQYQDNCDEVLLHQDRIQIIEQIYGETKKLWQNSKCSSCFADTDLNPPRLSDDTKKFIHLALVAHDCIANTNDTTTCRRNSTDNCKHAACTNCSKQYADLGVFYNMLESSAPRSKLCMDIVDLMNTTRRIWSDDLNCVSHHNDVEILFIVISFLCLLPPVFYLGSYFQSDEQKSKIVPQSRLASSRSAAQLAEYPTIGIN